MSLPPITPGDTLPIWAYVGLWVLAVIIGGGVGVAALYSAIRKTPVDIKKGGIEAKREESDYVSNLQEITSKATAENKDLRSELYASRKEFDDLTDRFDKFQEETAANIAAIKAQNKADKDSLTAELAEEREARQTAVAEIGRLKAWVDLLLAQLKAADIIPAPYPRE